MRFEVAKDRLAETRRTRPGSLPLAEDQARLRVDTFGLTTNNITYAVYGGAMQYWDFFPTEEPETWGCIPVWGFADVVESASDACAVGERLYGYLPMASDLVVTVGRADEQGLADVSAHRAPMAGAYNRYVRCAADPGYDASREAQQMLLYPLFVTSFLIDDFFADRAGTATDAIVLSSASSKTAIGIAYLAHRRGRHVIGLTSDRHRPFVESLGVYGDVMGYDEITARPGSAVYADMSGNVDVRHAVHTAYGDRLGHSMVVGGTHWDHAPAAPAATLPGPTPEFFFAPARIVQRHTDWGREDFDRRVAEAWRAYSAWTDSWLAPQRAVGPDAVGAAYAELLGGGTDPRTGYVCSLPESATGA
jgi:hypothetical protein